jgi:DNA modification methylase
MADWSIITGDAVEELRRLAARPRLIFADPPYNVGIDYGEGERADRLPAAAYVAWVETWVGLCRQVLADDGAFWLLIADEFVSECDVVGKRYFTRRSWVIWHETFGANCTNKFNRTHRHLLHFVKDPARFVFHPEAVRRRSARQVVHNDGRAHPAGKLWDDVWCIPRLVGNAKERIEGFPTQLPLELLRPVVECCTDPGDLVLDPFSGSATTGAAALESRRRFLGIEKREHFAERARRRLSRRVARDLFALTEAGT